MLICGFICFFLSSLNEMNANLSITGSLDNLDIRLTSTLDSKFEFIYNRLKKDQLDRMQNDLKSELKLYQNQLFETLLHTSTDMNLEQKIRVALRDIKQVQENVTLFKKLF